MAGGLGSNFPTNSEVYDPASGTWSFSGSLTTGRYQHTATLLADGNVLVAGGVGLNKYNSSELYDLTSGTWSVVGNLIAARVLHTATLLPNGKVLVAAGYNALLNAELYDPASGTWSVTGSLNTAHYIHTATLLQNGKVLVAGGANNVGVAIVSSELYEPPGPTPSPTATPTSSSTPMPTPTATPSCAPIVINGSIDGSDPTQHDRLDRFGFPLSCGHTPNCPGGYDGLLHHYDSYTFTNTTGSNQCPTVVVSTACTGNNYIFVSVYLGSFDPTNVCANYIGDEGRSPGGQNQFSFDLGIGQRVVLVVTEVNSGGGCPLYTLTVTGLCSGPSPTPTITPTPTPTITPTPTPTATPTPTSHRAIRRLQHQLQVRVRPQPRNQLRHQLRVPRQTQPRRQSQLQRQLSKGTLLSVIKTL